MATLSYEGRAPGRVAPPPSRRFKVAVGVASVMIVLLFLVALPPARQSAALDYTRDIPLSEAIDYSIRADWSTVFTDHATAGMVWFAPVALACAVTFMVARQTWLTRSTVALSVLAPFLWTGPGGILLPLIAVIAFPAVFGQQDGETWSEGFVAAGCMGAWMIQWTMVVLLLCLPRKAKCHPRATGTLAPVDG